MGGSRGTHFSRRMGLGRGGAARSLGRRKRTRGRFPWGGPLPAEDQTGRPPGGAWSRFLPRSVHPRGRKGGDSAGDALGPRSGGGATGQRRGRCVTRGGGRSRPGPGRVQVWEGSGRQVAPFGQTGTTSPRDLGLARFPNPSLSPTVRSHWGTAPVLNSLSTSLPLLFPNSCVLKSSQSCTDLVSSQVARSRVSRLGEASLIRITLGWSWKQTGDLTPRPKTDTLT